MSRLRLKTYCLTQTYPKEWVLVSLYVSSKVPLSEGPSLTPSQTLPTAVPPPPALPLPSSPACGTCHCAGHVHPGAEEALEGKQRPADEGRFR